jgi:CRISPR/Cas system-associated exonuclease Cas4 (RecB family)
VYKRQSEKDAASRGSLIHRILSGIHSGDDVAKALNAAFIQGNLREDALPGIKAQIHEMLSHPDIAPYFESTWTVKNEAAIILPDGHILRPDRVVIRGKEAVVIDYKTGRPKENHKVQIQQYAEVLKRMGYEVRKSILAYLDDGLVVEVE